MDVEGVQIEAFEGAFVRRGHGVPAEWNALTHAVIGCAMRVHSALGPGLPERLYAAALRVELNRASIDHECEVIVRVAYDQEVIGHVRLDMLVAGVLVIELKAVESVHDLHLAQLVSYLRAGGRPLGLLINFNVLRLKDGIYRRLNADAMPP